LSLTKKLSFLLVSSAMIGLPLGASVAAEGGGSDMINYVAPHGACGALTWHFSRINHADGSAQINGPIWFTDGTGVSFATGKGAANGSFTLQVTKISGNGPSGTVTGKRGAGGEIDATATGSNCFAGQYHLMAGQTTTK